MLFLVGRRSLVEFLGIGRVGVGFRLKLEVLIVKDRSVSF